MTTGIDFEIDEKSLNAVTFNNSLFFITNNYNLVVIPGNVSDPAAVNSLLDDLQNRNWITRNTRVVRMSFVLYNGNWNVFIRNDLVRQFNALFNSLVRALTARYYQI